MGTTFIIIYEVIDMDKRLTFNEEVANYDKYRPRYCKELFDSIIEYAGLDGKKKAIEVGIGTGQATTPILQTGCFVSAIELGDKLASYSKAKFSEYDNFTIQNIAFEDYKFNGNSIDLIYSGTAFHWIPEEVGYRRAYDMLRSGGAIALFWNRPSVESVDIHSDIQSIYAKYRPIIGASIKDNQEVYNKIMESINRYGFIDLQFKLMYQTRSLSAEEYVSLLNTYSDHRSMESDIRKQFYTEIKEVINRYGGNVTIHDTIDLYLAKKP